MDRFCCVSGCDNRAIRDKLDGKGQTIGYFHFPPEKEARRRAIRIHGDPGPPDHHFSTSREKCICSMHFEEELAIPAMTTTELPLTKEAIPTVFSASGISDGDTSTAVQTANDNQRDMSEDVGESDDPNDSANDGRKSLEQPAACSDSSTTGIFAAKMDATQGPTPNRTSPTTFSPKTTTTGTTC
ncbi:hypothetical protein BV898_13249 [Hypsibius exemplaris]|uniref:THAP-type domain-containing protein n=1 Tax=Hypsibius exemplaris TaxID=2072580 RepID=A0A1W0WBI7_HYPEX|nr:hypothetical protein BV898_13249 [Hypsibius exemplaris]